MFMAILPNGTCKRIPYSPFFLFWIQQSIRLRFSFYRWHWDRQSLHFLYLNIQQENGAGLCQYMDAFRFFIFSFIFLSFILFAWSCFLQTGILYRRQMPVFYISNHQMMVCHWELFIWFGSRWSLSCILFAPDMTGWNLHTKNGGLVTCNLPLHAKNKTEIGHICFFTEDDILLSSSFF